MFCLGNTAIPRVVPQNQIIGFLIVVMAEVIILQYLLGKKFKFLILLTLIANLISSYCFYLLAELYIGHYYPFNSYYIFHNIILTVLIDFPLSLLIEFPIIWLFLSKFTRQKPKLKLKLLIKSVIFSQVASYLLIIIYIIFISLFFPVNIERGLEAGVRDFLNTSERIQIYFQSENGYFNEQLSEVPEYLGSFKSHHNKLKRIGDNIFENDYYKINWWTENNIFFMVAKSKSIKYRSMVKILQYNGKHNYNSWFGVCSNQNESIANKVNINSELIKVINEKDICGENSHLAWQK